MNKKLVILLVFVMISVSVIIIALFGLEPLDDGTSPVKVTKIEILDENKIPLLSSEIILVPDKSDYVLYYRVSPDDATNKKIKIIHNQTNVMSEIKDDKITINILVQKTVTITIVSAENNGIRASVTFVYEPPEDTDPL